MLSRSIVVIGLVSITVALGQTAVASEGSVPAEVAAYAADPEGLLASLDDLAGVAANGQGIDFEGAEAGQLNRVFEFTDAFLAGEPTETPVQHTNEWTAPIILADKPLGLAVIWINQSTLEPELADFTEGASVGAALMDVPVDATLVRDREHAAWFTLVGEDLAPLHPGTSGVAGPMPIAEYRDVLAAGAPVTPAASPVPMLSIAVIAVSILVIAAVLLLPALRARARARAAAAIAEPVVEVAALEPAVIEAARAPSPAAAAKKPAASTAAKQPATKKPAVSSPAKQPAAKQPAKPAAKRPAAKRPPKASPAE